MQRRVKPSEGFYVYALFRDDGRVFYIGKGHGKRWLDHAIDARMGKRGHRFSIIRDMQARGVEMPKVRLHEGLTESAANAYEVALIAAIGRYPDGPLVNQTNGGDGLTGFMPSQETRAKLSAARTGRVFSPETRARLSIANQGKKPSRKCILAGIAAHTGKKQSLEHVAKVLATRRSRPLSEEALTRIAASALGKKWTPERIAKRSATVRGRSRSQETKAKLAAANLGKKQSVEHCAKISAGLHAYHARRRAVAD